MLQETPQTIQLDSSQTRHRWADIIRALGAFLVVMAHVSFFGAGSPLVQTIYYAVTRAAVPMFFIASGYLLLSKEESLWDFFRKRAMKVFLPFLIWSVIYLLWHNDSFGEPVVDIIKSYIVKIIRGPRENHLWFFYELFGLYLFAPVLRVYLKSASRKDMAYFIGAWLLLVIMLRLFAAFYPLQIGFTYYFLGGYIGYFLFGHFVRAFEITKPYRIAAWAIFFLSLTATIAGMYFKNEKQYFDDYLSLNVVFMSCAMFTALKDLPVSDSAYRWIAPLSRASFGIYLAHVLVMTEIFSTPPFSILTQIGSNFYMIPLLAILGFTFSFALTFVLQKIPVLKNIVP